MQTTINLATRHYYNRRQFKLLLLFICLTLLTLSAFGIYRLIGYRTASSALTAEISAIDKRLAGSSGVSVQELNTHGRQLAAIHAILAQRRNSRLTLLDTLESASLNGITITAITPDQKNKSFRLEGRTRSLAILSNLLERLGAANGVRKPTLVSTENTPHRGMPGSPEGIGFVLTMGWDGP